MKLEIISRIPENPKSPPLLFVHGALHGAWCWEDYFLPYFEQAGYPVYAFSMRGHGKSEGSIDGATLSDYLEDIRQVALQMPEPPILIGHSLGGFLALKYLEKYPVKGAVLMASMLPFPLYMRLTGIALGKPFRYFLRNRQMRSPQSTESARRLFFTRELPEEQLQRYVKLMCNDSLLSFIGLLWEKNPKPELVRQVPVRLQVNATDTMRKFLPDQKFAALYGAEHRVYYGTAHNMMLESNWREAADDILAWLSKHFPAR